MVIRFLLEKEFRQMMRNAVLPRVFIALPLALLAIIPLVATQEVKNLKVGVVDADRSPLSERLVQKLAASDFFVLTGVFASYDDALRDLEQGGGDLILEIGPDFERGLANGEESAVMVSAHAVTGVKTSCGGTSLKENVTQYTSVERDVRPFFYPEYEYESVLGGALNEVVHYCDYDTLGNLVLEETKNKGVDYHKINTVFTTREPNSFIIRTVKINNNIDEGMDENNGKSTYYQAW